METLLSSFALVAASEMGDKTQLLAFSLSARFKRPLPILAGILVATILNHALAAAVGSYVAGLVSEQALRWGLALTFFAFALWTLKPDTLDDEPAESRWGAFLTTAILFFLAEMGDKTQLATVALGARFASTIAVTTGTTLGMLAADGLAVFAGHRLAERLPMNWIRRAAALLFAIFGLLVLLGQGVSLQRDVSSVEHSRGSWVGERDDPRAYVLVAHGLNLKPSKMRALAEAVCNEQTRFVCRIVEMAGHEETGPSRMKQIRPEVWTLEFQQELALVANQAQSQGVPLRFLGYSLGALLGEWSIQHSAQPLIDRAVLIAPAITPHGYTRLVTWLPLFNGAMLGSRNHPEYRANEGTSLAAYRAMFSLVGDVQQGASQPLDIPTLVFVNTKDELVSEKRLARWMERRGLRHWEIEAVLPLQPSISPSYQHLMIDEPSMGVAAWSRMAERIRQFLD